VNGIAPEPFWGESVYKRVLERPRRIHGCPRRRAPAPGGASGGGHLGEARRRCGTAGRCRAAMRQGVTPRCGRTSRRDAKGRRVHVPKPTPRRHVLQHALPPRRTRIARGQVVERANVKGHNVREVQRRVSAHEGLEERNCRLEVADVQGANRRAVGRRRRRAEEPREIVASAGSVEKGLFVPKNDP